MRRLAGIFGGEQDKEKRRYGIVKEKNDRSHCLSQPAVPLVTNCAEDAAQMLM